MDKNNISSRPNYLDYAKAITMFLVVLGHYGMTAHLPVEDIAIWNIDYFITMFHMPLFFIVSGMLYSAKPVNIVISKCWKQLLIPYFCMSIIVFGLVTLTDFVRGCFVLKNAALHLCGIMCANDFFGTDRYGGALWFLWALAIVKMIMAITETFKNKDAIRFIVCLSGVYLTFCGNVLPFRFDSALVGFLFYCVGYYGKTIIARIVSFNNGIKILLFAVSLLITLYASTMCLKYGQQSGAMSINAMTFGDYPLLFILSAIIASVGKLCMSEIMSKYKSMVILKISNGSVVILGFHWIVFLFIFNFYKTDDAFGAIIISLAVTAICYGLILLSERYAPILLGNRKYKAEEYQK